MPTARGTLRIPVDENVAALIPYRGFQGSFTYISASDVLADRIPAEQLKGKIVLMGTTAPGLMDLRATPVGSTYPGVEIHANLISGMLDGAIKYRPAYVLGADVLLVLIAGGVMVFLLPLLSPFRATIVALIVLLFLITVNLTFWHVGNMVLPLAAGPAAGDAALRPEHVLGLLRRVARPSASLPNCSASTCRPNWSTRWRRTPRATPWMAARPS